MIEDTVDRQILETNLNEGRSLWGRDLEQQISRNLRDYFYTRRSIDRRDQMFSQKLRDISQRILPIRDEDYPIELNDVGSMEIGFLFQELADTLFERVPVIEIDAA